MAALAVRKMTKEALRSQFGLYAEYSPDGKTVVKCGLFRSDHSFLSAWVQEYNDRGEPTHRVKKPVYGQSLMTDAVAIHYLITPNTVIRSEDVCWMHAVFVYLRSAVCLLRMLYVKGI